MTMKITGHRVPAPAFRRWIILVAILATICLPLAPQTARADRHIPDNPPPGPFFPTDKPITNFPSSGSLLLDGFEVYLPLVLNGADTGSGSGGWVNTQNRAESRAYYLNNYASQTNIPTGWSGNFASCSPGNTSAEFRAAVLKRVNYFRQMAGIPPVTFSQESNRLAQAAAFLMSVNDNLSHTPPPSWECYTQDAASGAGSSNLAWGVNGWEAISGYMEDWAGGNINDALGHRRWILYPRTRVMGTGDIPAGNGHPATNALRIMGDLTWDERPDTRDNFVAWPPPGYVPRPVVFAAWSISYPGADFSSASVTMTSSGSPIALDLLPIYNGYGENTLAWAPTLLPGNGDISYQVSVQGVLDNGAPRNFTYTVILFTP